MRPLRPLLASAAAAVVAGCVWFVPDDRLEVAGPRAPFAAPLRLRVLEPAGGAELEAARRRLAEWFHLVAPRGELEEGEDPLADLPAPAGRIWLRAADRPGPPALETPVGRLVLARDDDLDVDLTAFTTPALQRDGEHALLRLDVRPERRRAFAALVRGARGAWLAFVAGDRVHLAARIEDDLAAGHLALADLDAATARELVAAWQAANDS